MKWIGLLAGFCWTLSTTCGVVAAQSLEAQNATEAQSVAAIPNTSDAGNTENILTSADRWNWIVKSTIGPLPIFTTLVESALQTETNSPREYGTQWDGYGKRVASKFGAGALSNTTEAGLGAMWGEDPRYHRLASGSKRERIWYAIKMGFLAENKAGETMPAYARYIAVPGTRLISNAWRPPSQTTGQAVIDGIGFGFARRMGSNAFSEFWPDVRKHIHFLK